MPDPTPAAVPAASPISNILGHPRTTIAGALGVLVGGLMSQVLPALANYFGAQPGPIWPIVGLLLGCIPAMFMRDQAKWDPAAGDRRTVAPPPAGGFVSALTSIALVIACAAVVACLSCATTGGGGTTVTTCNVGGCLQKAPVSVGGGWTCGSTCDAAGCEVVTCIPPLGTSAQAVTLPQATSSAAVPALRGQ